MQGQFSMEESLHEFSGKNHEVMTLGALTEGPWYVLSQVTWNKGSGDDECRIDLRVVYN